MNLLEFARESDRQGAHDDVHQVFGCGAKNVAANNCGADSVIISKHRDCGAAGEGAAWTFLTVSAAPHHLFAGFR
jgi:hypothetical protein